MTCTFRICNNLLCFTINSWDRNCWQTWYLTQLFISDCYFSQLWRHLMWKWRELSEAI